MCQEEYTRTYSKSSNGAALAALVQLLGKQASSLRFSHLHAAAPVRNDDPALPPRIRNVGGRADRAQVPTKARPDKSF